MGIRISYIIAAVIIIVLVAFLIVNVLSLLISRFYNSTSKTSFGPNQFVGYHKYYPQGVVSYGLYNSLWIPLSNGAQIASYNLSGYQVTTNAIFGCVKISSLSAYTYVPFNMIATSYLSKSGASLQLNVNLVVDPTDGKPYIYLLQNAMMFNTSGKKYQAGDNILNVSTNHSTIKESAISGNGAPRSEEVYSNGSMYYAALPNNLIYNPYTYDQNERGYIYLINSTTATSVLNLTFKNYTLPFTYCPIIKIYSSGTYPVVKFGYSMNGYSTFFDNVTLLVPAKKYYLLVTPYKLLPTSNLFYDAEFVFAGEGENENSTFNSLNATGMWLFYYANNTFVPFPSLDSSGWDTGEGATNLQVSQGSNYASVTVGTENLFSNMTLPSSEYNSTEYLGVASWIENSR